MYPIHIEYQKKYLTVAFIISDKSIMNAISDNYNLNNMDIFIIDEDNNVLATMGSNGFIKGQISPKFFTGLEKNEISTATYDKQKYVLTNSNIKDTGLTIVMAANEKELYKTVRTSRTSLLVLIFVLLIIGVTLIMLIVLKSNKQILKIKSQLGISSDGDIFAGSELDQIITWVDNIIIQKEMIEAKYNSNNKLVKNQLLEMLLKGEISNISNLKGWGDDSELELVKGWFSVFAMKPYEDKCRMYYEWDVDILNSVLSKYPNLNTLELSDENVFVLIICADSAKKVEEFELEIISVIQNIYPNHFVKIGIGKRYGQISYLNNSFFEAQIALDNIINKNNQLLRYEDIIFQKEGVAYWNLNEEQAKFIQCVKYGNLEGAKSNLDIMLDTIATRETSYLYRNLAYIDIINMLIKVCKNNDIFIDQETISELSNISNFDQIQVKLEAVLEKSFANIKNEKEEQTNQILQNIIQYINNNFCNSDISLESVADYFNVAPHFLSRFIKEKLNISFTDYLVQLRMDEFKRLMLETDKPIKELITAVGYIDTSSFVRKFKKKEGITPGAYRANLKNG